MLSVKYQSSDGRETIVGNVATVTVESDELGNRVVAHVANGGTWTFGPVSPSHSHRHDKVFVMSETGQTVADYMLFPGSQEAWDKLGEDAPMPMSMAA